MSSFMTKGGSGQGCTTRAFGESDNILYAGGGGGSSGTNDGDLNDGGAGGGGKCGSLSSLRSGQANTGGGGAGGGGSGHAGSGGSGVILIRTSQRNRSIVVSSPEDNNTAYRYRVRACGEAGLNFYSDWAECRNTLRREPDVSSDFTDNELIPRVTPVKAVHMIEMQDRVNTLLDFYYDGSYAFDNVVSQETHINKWPTHMGQIHTAFDDLEGIHEEWKAIPSQYPDAETMMQLRRIIQDGHKVQSTFYNDGNEVCSQIVTGGNPVQFAGDTPIRRDSRTDTFVFAGWSVDRGGTPCTDALWDVRSNRSIYAEYISTPKRFIASFMNGNELLFATQVTKDAIPQYRGNTPVRNDVDTPSDFEFDGWYPPLTLIEEDSVFNAYYSHALLTETIKEPWEAIMASIDDGSYYTKYKAGDTKELNLGELGYVNMVVAEVNPETSDEPPMIWISEQALPTSLVYSSEKLTTWESSELRSYLHTTVKPFLPEAVQSHLAPVHDTMDEVWVPSYDEVCGATSRFYSLFQNTASKRIKKVLGGTTGVAWWLRDVYGYNSTTTGRRYISASGSASNSTSVTVKYYPVLCFSTTKISSDN